MEVLKSLPARERSNLEKFVSVYPSAGELFDELTDEQASAVSCYDSHSVIYAGPGAGKTKTIIGKILFVVGARLVKEENVLAVTFTRAAAREMRERLSRILGRETTVTVSTIHSLAYRFLKETGHLRNYRVADEEILEQFYHPYLKEIEDVLRGKVEDVKDLDFLLRYGLAKLDGTNVVVSVGRGAHESVELLRERYYNLVTIRENGAHVPESAKEDFLKTEKFVEALTPTLKKIKDKLKKERFITFTDILVLFYRRVSKDPKFRSKVAGKYPFVFIDEFQDVSYIQFASFVPFRKGKVTVVGDDDQSIYTWRSAYPYVFDEFKRIFNPKEFYLTRNFRSKEEIVALANSISSQMEKRVSKKIKSVRGKGGKVYLVTYETGKDYTNTVSNRAESVGNVVSVVARHYSPQDVAVLVTENAASRWIERELLKLGFPVVNLTRRNILDMKESIYSGWIISTFLYDNAYRELAVLIKESTKGVGDSALKKMLEIAEENDRIGYGGFIKEARERKILKRNVDFWEKFVESLEEERGDFLKIPEFLGVSEIISNAREIVDGIFSLYSDVIERLAEETAKKRVKKPSKKVLEQMSEEEKGRELESYERFLQEKKDEFYSNLEAVKEYVTQSLTEALSSLGKSRISPDEWKEIWESVRADVVIGKDSRREEFRNGIKIMTVHQAKGLEFPCVVYSPASFSRTTEEGKRVAYVAVTRAKDVALVCLSDFHLKEDPFWKETIRSFQKEQKGGIKSEQKQKRV